jgi:hypothetical protein
MDSQLCIIAKFHPLLHQVHNKNPKNKRGTSHNIQTHSLTTSSTAANSNKSALIIIFKK